MTEHSATLLGIVLLIIVEFSEQTQTETRNYTKIYNCHLGIMVVIKVVIIDVVIIGVVIMVVVSSVSTLLSGLLISAGSRNTTVGQRKRIQIQASNIKATLQDKIYMRRSGQLQCLPPVP